MSTQVKVIGANGQISLGKEFAGKTVVIEIVRAGVWVIKSGQFMPDSEQWVHASDHMPKLETALEWAEKNQPADNFDELSKGISSDKD